MFKLFVTFLCTVALASAVFAQNIYIALPPANTDVTAGKEITVQLDRPMTLSGSEEVAVVIGTSTCPSPTTCRDVAEVLGDILYNGPFNPVLSDDSWSPYQNITITIPSWYRGPVQIGVAHFFLLGAGLNAQLQLTNTTVNAVAPS
ncbi:hypothetical protein EV363DRAFT_1381535 [Boletus edulis]|uniref:Uncharacterized protein n=1 Tax=Boletus edulis BED1 TaxID=1328754 RepID=A0AAD4C3C0_BOLED|nr:hypothetical protein EV363DRAFT_1381535 [Boletus edulis]KAF8422149.1 hypothetical protein L210DRAFT_3571580 [Boletus edulis BED1]KAF8447167.1 hypothetical protein L210DRAFT_3525066 [Boletus edulis BED1]